MKMEKTMPKVPFHRMDMQTKAYAEFAMADEFHKKEDESIWGH